MHPNTVLVHAHYKSLTRVFGGGVGQVEATSALMVPTHELDSDLVSSGLNQLFDLHTSPAVFHCEMRRERERERETERERDIWVGQTSLSQF